VIESRRLLIKENIMFNGSHGNSAVRFWLAFCGVAIVCLALAVFFKYNPSRAGDPASEKEEAYKQAEKRLIVDRLQLQEAFNVQNVDVYVSVQSVIEKKPAFTDVAVRDIIHLSEKTLVRFTKDDEYWLLNVDQIAAFKLSPKKK
jgi:hypothetical protein